jgi:Bacterial protein of unknown function (HtrL_YibB)
MFENLTEETILSNLPSFEEYYKNILVNSEPYELAEFFEKPGKNHYYLLAYLSTKFNNVNILDIGTHYGKSALALSYNKTNQIHTFNIQDQISNQAIRDAPNIHFHISNLLDPSTQKEWIPFILQCPFIVLDIDPHNGTEELEFVNFLVQIKYKGFLVCDDIWYFKGMRDNFWYKLETETNEYKKYDITLLGHWSGTGVISFNKDICFPSNDVSNWTLVTAYFNLSISPDANQKIKERDSDYYFSHAISTLSLPYNLVIYCDEESLETIKSIRPAFLADKTQYIIRNFYDLKFKKNGQLLDKNFSDYREKIADNRKNNNYYIDNRNTPSYYLFCMARYLMLKEVIEENNFGSTHFAWINFCIERMGFQNLVHLEEALAVNRDKFSTCYIDYISEAIVRDVPQYYWYGRCSMCSGFFTGNSEYMYKACDLIENRFLQFLEMGHGHADEQLYSAVYFDYPEIFDHYYGDYYQMITNYKYIYDAPDAPINNFIRNSFDAGNYKKCYEACQYVWKSHCLGKCNIPDNWLEYLFIKYMWCKTYISRETVGFHR